MGLKFNLISGIFAALGASCGMSRLKLTLLAKIGFDFGDINMERLPINVVFIVGMILCNVLMMKFYMSSCQENGAGKATVYNFVVNYLASICFGAFFFNEEVTYRLVAGVLLILSGTFVISMCESKKDPFEISEAAKTNIKHARPNKLD